MFLDVGSIPTGSIFMAKSITKQYENRPWDHRLIYENADGRKDIRFTIDDTVPDERYIRIDLPPILGAEHTYRWFSETCIKGVWNLTCSTDSYYALKRYFE